jgi:alkanesulfonate monooxygenase SsuD/methylene tetrahydromethanopterin reductase-like flavin-dependent oxidoreductase (luciferase family)
MDHGGPVGRPARRFLGANLIGTPEEVCRRVAAIEQAGVDHLAGLVFPGRTVEEVLDQMEEFASTVVKQFPEPPALVGPSLRA